MGYAENMYQWLKRNGYADKYDHAGIYCIKIDNIIVYIVFQHNHSFKSKFIAGHNPTN